MPERDNQYTVISEKNIKCLNVLLKCINYPGNETDKDEYDW
jgi:hypothetical protein